MPKKTKAAPKTSFADLDASTFSGKWSVPTDADQSIYTNLSDGPVEVSVQMCVDGSSQHYAVLATDNPNQQRSITVIQGACGVGSWLVGEGQSLKIHGAGTTGTYVISIKGR